MVLFQWDKFCSIVPIALVDTGRATTKCCCFQIWSQLPKSGDTGSRGSTIRSSDSGHETLEGSSVSRDSDDVLRRNDSRHEPRPQTIGAPNFSTHYFDYSDPDYVQIFCQKPPLSLPPPPPVPTSHPPPPLPPSSSQQSSDMEYVNLDQDFSELSLKKRKLSNKRSIGSLFSPRRN